MTNDPNQDLLWKLLKIYPQNHSQWNTVTVKHPDETNITFSTLSNTDQALIEKFENARIRGIIAARRRDLDTAKHLFTTARLLLKSNLLSQEGLLFYQSNINQGEAFLDCRYGNFEQARQRTLHSISIDQELEDNYGHHDLILHRIQQVHNLARIEAYDNQTRKAIRLTLEILSYLDGRINSLSVPGIWEYKRIATQPAFKIANMFLQITSEISLMMAGMSCQEAGRVFTLSAEKLLTFSRQESCHPYAYEWLTLKQAYSYGDVKSFLSYTADFITRRYEGMGLLFYSTIIDLINVCDQINTPLANELKQEIAKNVRNHPQEVPTKFLSFFKPQISTQQHNY